MALEDLAGYSLRRKLGSGSAGTVWLVRDRASGRNAVLKRVPTTAISHPEELRESLTILQRIDHPHLARLREVRETDTEWLLFGQYVVAGTLTALLSRRGPLNDGELVTLLSPLAEALDYLHGTGLTHGRVTPANIMFDADGRPVLTDAVVHTTHPTAPNDDLAALAAVAHQSGGDPTTFTPDLFTTTHPHDLLTLRAPIPIDLAFTKDTPPSDAPSNDPTTNDATSVTGTSADATSSGSTTSDPTSTAPPRPRPTTKPPTTDDDPIQRSRNPLTPHPRVPSIPERTSQPRPSQPPPPKPSRSSAKTKRRKPLLPKLTRRTRRTPVPINPLTRLTPPPPTPSTPAAVPTPPTRSAATCARLPDAFAHRATRTGSPTSTSAASSASSAGTTDGRAPETAATPHLANSSSTEGATSTSIAWADAAPGSLRPPGSPSRTARRGRRTWRRRSARWRRSIRPVHTAWKSRLPASATPGSASAAGMKGVRRFGFRHPAYRVLAAVGLGAVVVLILGLLTVGVLDNPAGTAAAADRTDPSPSPATTSSSPMTPAQSPSRTAPTQPPTAVRPTTPEPPSRVDTGEWTRTLRALDAQRAQAFWTLDLALLDTIYVPGTEPWAADRALLATYRKHQIRVRGLQIHIDRTTIESQTSTTVVLRTVDHLTAGQAIDPTGTTTNLPAATPATRRITLSATPTTTPSATTSPWRITAIATA